MTFRIRPIDYVILVGNILQAEEADYSCEQTKAELLGFLNHEKWQPLPKRMLEEALYCCNMNNERGEFWHPLKYDFAYFLNGILPRGLYFDYNWNLICERKQHGTTP